MNLARATFALGLLASLAFCHATTESLQRGWMPLATSSPDLGQATVSSFGDGTLCAQIQSAPGRFRVSGFMTNQSEWLPYSQIGSHNYVRVKYYVWAMGQPSAAPNLIPNLRLRAQTRFAVTSMLEVLHHSNNDPGANDYTQELRPSQNIDHPSLYRVDFDPVDVPYLVSNASTEGVQRAFEAYSTDPQDCASICVAESQIATYPAALLADERASTSATKIYRTSRSDAGDLKVINPQSELFSHNIELRTTPGEFPLSTSTLPLGSYSEGTFGVKLDTSQVPPFPICGIVSREFHPEADPQRRIRVEEGCQYKIRWHLTSVQQTNRQAQIQLRARTCKFAWIHKLELGGAWATGGSVPNASNTIAQQALPGIGCQNPDKNAHEFGGWYTLIVHTPLCRDVRADFPGQPLSVSMPRLTSCPGPGSPSTQNDFRDLKVGCDLVDTLSQGTNSHLEQGSFTLDRIEVRSFDFVDDSQTNPAATTH